METKWVLSTSFPDLYDREVVEVFDKKPSLEELYDSLYSDGCYQSESTVIARVLLNDGKFSGYEWDISDYFLEEEDSPD